MEKRTRKDKMILVGLICFLIIFISFSFVWLPAQQRIINVSYKITDKYIDVDGFLGSVHTRYNLVLDNGSEVSVTREEYNTYSIGDMYNRTEFKWSWEVR